MNRLSELLPVGPPINETQQIGRTGAIDSLEARLRSLAVVKMLEPRRVGKTSVARAALERIRSGGGSVAEVNLATRSDPETVARDLAVQLAGGARRRISGITSALRRSGADGATGEEGGFVLRVAEELLNGSACPATVLERAAARTKASVTTVLLDEAHILATWPEPMRTAMGGVLKDNKTLGVVVASSEQRALERLTSSDGPLRFVGTRFNLPPIAQEDWSAGLRERFATLAAPITPAALTLLLDQSQGHPYCTMLLAHESGRLGMDLGEVTETVVQAALGTASRDEAWRELL